MTKKRRKREGKMLPKKIKKRLISDYLVHCPKML
jgi:hypothetical protein